MRPSLSLRSSLTLAALCAAAGSPVAAQQSAVAANVRAAVNTSTAPEAPLPRTVAVYTFGSSRSAGLPAQVTVADSAGTWFASFRMPGARELRPMAVDARDGDLYLQGETSVGVLTLVLYPIDSSEAGIVIGRWSVGNNEGELRRTGVR